MEYTNVEKQVLSLMEKTDFKNLSKNDVLSYASKLNELRPEVAKQVLAQFPELAKLIHNTMTGYKESLKKIIESDNESTNQVYSILNEELKETSESRKEYIEFADKIHSDLSKCLDTPNLPAEEREKIYNREMELLNKIHEKDTEIREKEMEVAHMADKKDSEQKTFKWKILGAASVVVITALGIGAAALGGKVDIKLPKKNK